MKLQNINPETRIYFENGKYRAFVHISGSNGKNKQLGYFENKQDAIEAINEYYNQYYFENKHKLPKGIYVSLNEGKPRFYLSFRIGDKNTNIKSSYNLYEIAELRLKIIHSLIDDLA